VPQRAFDPPREVSSDKPSNVLLVSVVAAVASTVLVAVVWFLDSQPRPGPVPVNGMPPGPPPSHNALLMSLALFTIAWVSVIVVACRDQALSQIVEIRRIATTTLELVEQRDTDAFLRGMRTAASQVPPQPDPPAGYGGGGGTGGGVVPLHRPPPENED
jgi:hypothetical protein